MGSFQRGVRFGEDIGRVAKLDGTLVYFQAMLGDFCTPRRGKFSSCIRIQTLNEAFGYKCPCVRGRGQPLCHDLVCRHSHRLKVPLCGIAVNPLIRTLKGSNSGMAM